MCDRNTKEENVIENFYRDLNLAKLMSRLDLYEKMEVDEECPEQSPRKRKLEKLPLRKAKKEEIPRKKKRTDEPMDVEEDVI